tara:strand:+ start:331 stop:522 length:192 start_codon:yes stop_codon:yes gene_type:complete
MITKEEYEEAQKTVLDYEEQLKSNVVLDGVSDFLITSIIRIDPEDSFIDTQLPIKLVDGHLSY